jgi:cold shock protein
MVPWVLDVGCIVATGKVLRFDQIRGYGFIAPTGGGEDIFLHVNDLLVEKSAVIPGITMEFEVENGDRGPKASAVRIVNSVPAESGLAGIPRATAGSEGATHTDGFCDVLPTSEFVHEITELLLEAEPALTGAQIIQIRRQLTAVAEKYGWVESGLAGVGDVSTGGT